VNPAWVLPQAELRALALALLEDGALEAAVARLEEYVAAHPGDAAPMRLRLAEAYLAAGKPTKAIEEVARLDGLPLDGKQRARTREIEQRAATELESGRLELE
jgi:DNA-binding SARP family transcriptional activator